MKKSGKSFVKKERLCNINSIAVLFSTGRALYLPPLKILYRIVPEEQGLTGVRVLISVPKRSFKKAVSRNLIRRRIKEAYRLNKSSLIESLSEKGRSLDIAIVYYDTVIHPYNVTERSIKEMIEKLMHVKC